MYSKLTLITTINTYELYCKIVLYIYKLPFIHSNKVLRFKSFWVGAYFVARIDPKMDYFGNFQANSYSHIHCRTQYVSFMNRSGYDGWALIGVWAAIRTNMVGTGLIRYSYPVAIKSGVYKGAACWVVYNLYKESQPYTAR